MGGPVSQTEIAHKTRATETLPAFRLDEVVAESLPNRTLRCGGLRGECAAACSAARLVDLAPKIVAGEADVFPAEQRGVREHLVGRGIALGPQVANGAVEIDRVPKDDGGRDQVQP